MKIIDGVKVLSFIRGRVRLRVDALKGARELSREVEQKLSQVPGISYVEANAVSAGLLVKYEHKRLSEPASVEALTAVLRELFPRLDVERLSRELLGG